MLHIQQISYQNSLPDGKIHSGKKVKINNLSYTCIERLRTLSHIDQKDYSIRHGVYFQADSWIVQADHNNIYYIMSAYKLTKTSPYFLYNGKRLSNNTSVEELLEKCGVYEKALKECA